MQLELKTNHCWYLENIIHKVRIDDIVSKSRLMTSGVPRGTVLSHLLYIIYVAGLSKIDIFGNSYSYADDTV